MQAEYCATRRRSALGMADRAATAEARAIHRQLAGLYALMEVQAAALESPDAPWVTGAEAGA